MLITFDEFLARLKQLGAVYRDVAPRTAKYPYWIYTYTNTQRLVASTGTWPSVVQRLDRPHPVA
ncbi:hypothetical protein ACVFZR_13100 [Lacticaseibacillus paracasei]